jgi:hypothetical protein
VGVGPVDPDDTAPVIVEGMRTGRVNIDMFFLGFHIDWVLCVGVGPERRCPCHCGGEADQKSGHRQLLGRGALPTTRKLAEDQLPH